MTDPITRSGLSDSLLIQTHLTPGQLIQPSWSPALLHSSFNPVRCLAQPTWQDPLWTAHAPCSHSPTWVSCHPGKRAVRASKVLRGGRSPVLGSAVIQPAGPTGEAEQGMEGTLHAVQRSLCGPHKHQGRASQPPCGSCNPVLYGSQQGKLWKEGVRLLGFGE